MESPWANSRAFCVDAAALAFIGCTMSMVAAGYMKIVDDVTLRWLAAAGSPGYPSELESIQNFHGSPLWVPICWAGGTLVGLLKVALHLDAYPSFLQDLLHQEVDPRTAGKIFLTCMASLLSGAALGPEAGLGAAGGALGTFLARSLSAAPAAAGGEQGGDGTGERRLRLYTLAGMVAAFGSILPSPWVALLLVLELSGRKHDGLGKEKVTLGNQSIVLLGLVGSLAWTLKYLVDPNVSPPLPGSLLDREFSTWMPLQALALGLASVLAILVYFVIAGACKCSFKILSRLVERRCGRRARIVVTASLAGLLTGVLGLLSPLSLTDGSAQIVPTLKGGLLGKLKAQDLVGVALGKCFAYWIAASGGLVGGIFFPLLYIGLVVGELTATVPGFDEILREGLPGNRTIPGAALTVPVMMASVPASVIPIPFTLAALPLSTFHLGPKFCVPVFIASLTAYMGLVGTGLMRKLLQRAA